MKIKKPKKLKKMNVKIDGELHAKVKQHVKSEGGIVEAFVERALEQRLAAMSIASKTRSGVVQGGAS